VASKIKQMADAEADRVEAEDNEPDPDEPEPDDAAEPEPAEPEPEPEPAEPEGAREPLSMEALAAALEAEGERHNAALEAAFGDGYASFEACPMCHLLGVVAPEAMMLDPDTIKCPQCRGWGAFLTESQVENHFVRQCPRCMGNGYIDKAFDLTTVASLEQGNTNPQPAPVEIPPMPYYDPTTNTWKTPDGQALVSVAS
jgi:hypothetical protein